MKKKILFLLTVLLTFTLSFCITSCSSDDDDNPSLAFDSNTIVGEWTITEVSGISEWYWIKEGKTLTFKVTTQVGLPYSYYDETIAA